MPLTPGTRIGAYEIADSLGAGGMGEVYQARDTKLNRSVALKILPPAFASDPDRLARFKREAQVLASLNHPNIAAIYGFEDQTSTHALVMELVPGQTLAAHIGSPMPAADALPIVRQIAAALEAAHEHGIVHRDLKPANVKVTNDGTVKVLDFGLAKAMAGDAGRTGDPSASPAELVTVTSPALTELGVILGTAGYMAPEQAKGKPVDRRADLWAMGVILFELLSGKALYRGETVTETIAHVITQPPDWNLLPATTPAGVRRLLRRCLEKDPRNRLQSAGDARIEIDELMSGAAGSDAGSSAAAQSGLINQASGQSPRRSASLLWLPWGIATVALAALVYALWPRPVVSQPLFKLDVKVASADELLVDVDNDGEIVALSPDGGKLVYIGSSPAIRRLYVKSLDSLDSQPIPGTEGASQPFFSPDGKSLGFAANGVLMRTQLGGGTPVPIVSAGGLRGATWGADDLIVYAADLTAGLSRVSASGGSPTALTTLAGDERSHRWPSFLPGGQAVLFTCQMSNGSYDGGTVEAVRLDSGERKVLVRGGTFPRYVASGHLLYVKQGAVYAIAFDPARLETHGEGRPVLNGVFSTGDAVGAGTGNGAAQIAVASNGMAVYLPASKQSEPLSRLAVVDRSGKVTYEFERRGRYRDPKFSPDGRKVALRVVGDRGEHLHILDLDRGTLTQILFDGQYSGLPVWSQDGQQIAYAGDLRGKGLDLVLSRSDGTGEQKVLAPQATGTRLPTSFSPDGRLLAFFEINPKTNMDVMVLSLADNTVRPFLNSPNIELVGTFSPTGSWMAYQVVDFSGKSEVFVRSYPDGGALRQVSNGGALPYWTRAGRELVYLAGRAMMAVDVTPEGNALTLGKPHQLFELPFGQPLNALNYDAFPDGNKFVVLLATAEAVAAEPRTHVTMVFNLFDEIRRITATK